MGKVHGNKGSYDVNDNNNNNNDYDNYKNVPVNENGDYILETKEEAKKRKISLYIIYISVFVQSLGASIVVTGVWPYLNTLKRNVQKHWLGAIVAANPLGQLVFSPIIGWLCNRMNSVRIPSLVCLVIFIISNAWYGLLPIHTTHVKYFMFISRFLVGVSSGSISACRTFITQGTLTTERTSAISYLSLFQALGFILGPFVQVLLTPLGKEGFTIVGTLVISMYSSTGWIASIVGCINLILYHPKLFSESNVAEREAFIQLKSEEQKNQTSKHEQKKEIDWSKFPPDYVGIIPVVCGFFIVFFNFSLLETLGTPVTIEQLGWTNDEATLRVGIATAISSIISLLCFFTIPFVCKRFDERLVLLVAFVISLVGRLFFFPFGGPVAPMKKEFCLHLSTNQTVSHAVTKYNCESMENTSWITQSGCPPEQKWCFEIPALNGVLMAIGYAICTLGYPYSVVLIQTIFSKMIGPRPQGLWQGALTAISAVARIIGPVFVAVIYIKFGTIATSAVATGLMVFGVISLGLAYKRLVPIKVQSKQAEAL